MDLTPKFDEKRAFKLLLEQTQLGPRFPGTKEHLKLIRFILSSIKPYATKTFLQKFNIQLRSRKAECANIIGYFQGKKGKRTVLIGTHFDTRPQADNEKKEEDKIKPIIGANDGASGTAILIELARIFKDDPSPLNVILSFFDAEDSGGIDGLKYAIGSDYYCRSFIPQKPDEVIILDMVGRKNLKMNIDGNSCLSERSVEMYRRIFRYGRKMGYSEFLNPIIHYIMCDHIPFIRKGIPSIILIDIDDPVWHTLNDIPENCDPKSLKAVGDVLIQYLWER